MYNPDNRDFDTAAFNVTIPADENAPFPGTTLIPITIPVNDDSINEAEQLFVVYVEVVQSSAVNTLSIGNNIHLCHIIDNDGKVLHE